jgi:FG-GAP repeat
MKNKIISILLMTLMHTVHAQNVGIGTTTPTAKLHVNGSFKLTDGTQGNGKVLTSDAAGAAAWQALASSNQTGGVGFGAWGDCSTRNISGFNPVVASDGGNSFGFSVSISGNYAIVGSYAKTVGANSAQGKAYIFNFNGSTWVQQAMLVASDGAANDYFGYCVSINGNYAIVGAYNKTVGASSFGQGKAYIFNFNGSSWVQQAILTAIDGSAYDKFGYSVSISGNYAIVGAKNKNVGAINGQGKAYIYNFNGTSWAIQNILTASDGAANDDFGNSVSISGTNAIIGASNKTISGNGNQGKAYIFSLSAGSWVQIGSGITASDGTFADNFGLSVSINGDYAIVGSPSRTVNGNSNQGKVYVFYFNGSTWIQQASLIATDGSSSDFLGFPVSISGNYAIIGASSKTISANSGQGAAYIYQNVNGTWLQLQKVTNPGGNTNFNFGYGAAIDAGRFLIGERASANSVGMSFFGKIEL